MPGLIADGGADRKRKRVTTNGGSREAKARKAPKTASTDDAGARISLMEDLILESPEHYDKISELQKLATDGEKELEHVTLAVVTLCRVFCRLIASEKLVKQPGASEKDLQVAQRLRERLRDYVGCLVGWIGSPDANKENIALTLLMRIVKAEASGDSKSVEQAWRNDRFTFFAIIKALLREADAEGARQEFVDKYLEEHDDVRFYTFAAVKQCLEKDQEMRERSVKNAIELLALVEGVPESADQLEDWYGIVPEGPKHPLLSLNAHRKGAREAWLAVFRSPLSQGHYKQLLTITTSHLLPWFTGHIELLADFLTDSFNQGGSTSLLALNGIFNLMTLKNLDYPDFYIKLYSLLDENVLHSKHRSRFLRLMETFMSSTHLPAAMVASFIKRLSRLALQAPPGAIVWIVPWVYNALKQHPPCTFMLHRPYHPAHSIYATHPKYTEEGMDDSFDMTQRDPMLTGAIDSSLWELETLRGHYHPNVATLAKIVAEQFTKREYQLEDFFDHSYASLLNAELDKEMKKVPVVEWDIPKRIVTTEDNGLSSLGTLLQSAIDQE